MRISDWSSDVCSSDLARAEADGAGAVETPDVHAYNGFPATVNTPDATSTVMSDLRQAGLGMHTLSQPLSGSEDFGIFGTAAQCPSVFWHFGGTALQSFDGTALAALAEGRIPPGTQSNHRSEERREGKECVRTCRSR